MLREFEGASVVSLKVRRKELIYVNLAKLGCLQADLDTTR